MNDTYIPSREQHVEKKQQQSWEWKGFLSIRFVFSHLLSSQGHTNEIVSTLDIGRR